jgi:hypothetical protein
MSDEKEHHTHHLPPGWIFILAGGGAFVIVQVFVEKRDNLWWALAAILAFCGGIIDLVWRSGLSRDWRAGSKWLATILVIAGGAVVFVFGRSESKAELTSGPTTAPQVSARAETQPTQVPSGASRPDPPTSLHDGMLAPRKARESSPATASVPPSEPAATNSAKPAFDPNACPPLKTDNPPGVSLRTGDLLVAAYGALYRLDSQFRESLIATGGYLNDVRAIVVGADRTIFVATHACRQGAVVRVDPKTGTQTVIAIGFGAATALAVAEPGKRLWLFTVTARAPARGDLLQVDEHSGASEIVTSFSGPFGARTLATHPADGSVYLADREVYRIVGASPVRVEIESLQNAAAIEISRSGEIFVGDESRQAILQLRRGTRTPVAVVSSPLLTSLGSMALANDEKSLFVGSGHGAGLVFRIALPLDTERIEPTVVWKAQHTGAQFVPVAVVRPGS